jgi:hypothetical protein
MMLRWLFLFLYLAACCAVVCSSTESRAEGCAGQKWCFEADDFAFRVTENEVTVEMLRQMGKGGDTEMLIAYALENPCRLFVGWLRPTPAMHSVRVAWNVGLQLKSGDVVWAEKWFLGTVDGLTSAYTPADVRTFIPGMNEESANHKSFIIVLSFPKTVDGVEWRNRHVTGLVAQ